MNCHRSKALVSVYVDGELSEELAGPLRRHLLDCAACRAAVAEAKSLSRWFVPTAPVEVPAGFAARVAALAFAKTAVPDGEPDGAGRSVHGSDRGVLEPSRAVRAPRHSVDPLSPAAGARALEAVAAPTPGADRTARFAMALAAVAAAVLIGLTLLLASGGARGFDGSALQAQPSEDVLKTLEELNRREGEAAPATPGTGAPTDTIPAPGVAPDLAPGESRTPTGR